MAKLDNDDLLEKMDWEGGLYEAIDYGVKAEDILDPEAAAIYAEAVVVWGMFEGIRLRLETYLLHNSP